MSYRAHDAERAAARYGSLYGTPERAAANEPVHVSVSADVAETHPLYGVAGWTVVLAVFMILDVIVAALKMIGMINLAARGLAGWYWLIVLVQGAMLAWAIVCVVKLFNKDKVFPALFTGMCVVSGGLTVLGMALGGFNWVALVQLVVAIIYIGYVQSSRRVLVTYRHLVVSNDPILHQPKPDETPGAPAAEGVRAA